MKQQQRDDGMAVWSGLMNESNTHQQTKTKMWDGTEGIQVVDMLCGWSHTVALIAEGVCMSWGENGQGQLGLGYSGGERVGSPRRIERLPQVLNLHSFIVVNGKGRKTKTEREAMDGD